jgi:hypothetical protein
MENCSGPGKLETPGRRCERNCTLISLGDIEVESVMAVGYGAV